MKVELVERVAGLAGDVGKLAVGRAALPSGSSHVLAWVGELREATCIDECCSNGPPHAKGPFWAFIAEIKSILQNSSFPMGMDIRVENGEIS